MSSSINLKENLNIRLIIKIYEFWFGIIFSILFVKIKACICNQELYNLFFDENQKCYNIVLFLLTFTI